MGDPSLAGRPRGNLGDRSFIGELSAQPSSPFPTGIEMKRLIRPATGTTAVVVALLLVAAAAARRRAPVASAAPPPPAGSAVTVVPDTSRAASDATGHADAASRGAARA